jgi:hypothetical protein
VRLTVEYYETLRQTLLWKALTLGKREEEGPSMRWDCANDRRALRDTSPDSYLASIEVWKTRECSARYQKDTACYCAYHA